MSAAGSTDGIRTLLAAEKRAAEVVKQARNRRAARMKQAKVEAQQEIEQFVGQLGEDMKAAAESNTSGASAAIAKINADADGDIRDLNKGVEENTGKVIQTLLDIVWKADPILHVNYNPQ